MDIFGSVHVRADPETVWRVATDPTLGPRWNPNIIAINNFDGGPIRAGSTWSQVLRVMGQEERMDATVIECEPPRRGIVQFTGTGSPRVTTTVQTERDGCLLEQHMELSVPSGFKGVALKLGMPLIRDQLQQALNRQKTEAELVGAAESASEVTGGT
jgi:uncharacterized protein YndB with AHSA1/START domain